MRTIAPGQELDYNFTLHRAGIWLYHCSTAPMSAHIAAGMFGAVIVPPHDLPRADREFYLVQSETYLSEHNGAEVNTAKIANETPDLTMFNGHANQYVFEPLKARVGERVRIWVLAAGPSRGVPSTSSEPSSTLFLRRAPTPLNVAIRKVAAAKPRPGQRPGRFCRDGL